MLILIFLTTDGVRVRIYKHEDKEEMTNKPGITPWSAAEERLKAAEPVAESGTIFIRNLWFSATEDDLEALLKQYGKYTCCLLSYKL